MNYSTGDRDTQAALPLGMDGIEAYGTGQPGYIKTEGFIPSGPLHLSKGSTTPLNMNSSRITGQDVGRNINLFHSDPLVFPIFVDQRVPFEHGEDVFNLIMT